MLYIYLLVIAISPLVTKVSIVHQVTGYEMLGAPKCIPTHVPVNQGWTASLCGFVIFMG
ncbi:hypothetical protein Avbf_10304 [Armadillidium vulgare]|nr:hypothetical protein Avbf_10304 [Armadillidium vulgare]